MSMRILVPLANGFEEIEALTIIDVLRRAGADLVTAGLADGPVEAAHRVRVLPDTTLEKAASQSYDAVVLPGGMPGTTHLGADARLRDCLIRHAKEGKWVAAICAAPSVLHAAGLLKDKRATCYPSFEEGREGTQWCTQRVVVDGKIVTSRGPGTALEFALKLVELLFGLPKANELRKGMLVA